jgi:hypothetical protein
MDPVAVSNNNINKPTRISGTKPKKSESMRSLSTTGTENKSNYLIPPGRKGQPEAQHGEVAAGVAHFPTAYKPQGDATVLGAETDNGLGSSTTDEPKFVDGKAENRSWRRSWLSATSSEPEEVLQKKPFGADNNKAQQAFNKRSESPKRQRGVLAGLQTKKQHRRQSRGSMVSMASGAKSVLSCRSVDSHMTQDRKDESVKAQLQTSPQSSFRDFLHKELAELEDRLVSKYEGHWRAGGADSAGDGDGSHRAVGGTPEQSAKASVTIGTTTSVSLGASPSVDVQDQPTQSKGLTLQSSSKASMRSSYDLHDWWLLGAAEQGDFAPQSETKSTRSGARKSLAAQVFGFGPIEPKVKDFGDPSDDPEEVPSALDMLITSPHNTRRVCWDVFGACLLFYDVIVLPLSAFDMPASPFLTVMEYFTLIFWTLDIPLTFFVGYHSDGNVVRDFNKIAMRYLRSFFLFDVSISAADWGMTLYFANSSQSSVGYVRFLRFARVFRLVRLLKLKRLMSLIHDKVNSEYTSIVISFLKLMAMTLMLCHGGAAIWYALGYYGPKGKNWVETLELKEKSFAMQYLVSLRLVLSTFLFEGVVDPENELECLFLTTLILFGLVVFSYILSKITSLMVELESMNADLNRELWMLRRFCKQRNVSEDLKRRIVRYLEFATEQRKNLIEEHDIKILDLLTKDLKDQLRYARHGEMFKSHALFATISSKFNVTLHRICGTALVEKQLAMQDHLFFASEAAKGLYLIIYGRISYILASGPKERSRVPSASEGGAPMVLVGGNNVDHSRDWLSEAALWTQSWLHRGDAMAEEDCLMFIVDTRKFGEVMNSSPSPVVKRTASTYGKEFVRLINQMQEQGKPMSDLANKEVVDASMDAASTLANFSFHDISAH